ncbi:MAG: hypothetical protein L3J21_09230 [Devosiaceae bacterium]|nr:hypothetical protein [Devosiaceae bacterium]
MSALAPFAPARLTGLFLGDVRNILREPVMLLVLAFAILPLLLFVLFQKPMNEAALNSWNIKEISRYVAPLVLLMPAYLIGWITGFLILEERDEGPLLALDVTPIGKNGVAIYRAALASFMGGAIALISMPFLFPKIGLLIVMTLVILCAVQAAMVNFTLPAIAKNKVQGLAMTKVINLFSLAPLLAFIPSPWRFLSAPLPGFWIGELIQNPLAGELSLLVLLFFAAVSHLVVLLLIYRFFSSHSE